LRPSTLASIFFLDCKPREHSYHQGLGMEAGQLICCWLVNAQGLEEKITRHHAILYSVKECTQSIDDRTKLAQVADHGILESVCAGVDRIDHSVVQARHLGQQIMNSLNAFSRKIQRPLQAILQSNFQTYLLMLQMQQDISPRPTTLLESNIKFEDALGEIKQLPYECFRHWEVEPQSKLLFEMRY